MSAYNCGCDPDLDERYPWLCKEYPNCAWGRTQRAKDVMPMHDVSEMTLNDYQRSLHTTYKDRHHECHALGLVGELAEVQDELKKDPKWLSIDRDVIRDVLIAAGRVADMVKKATAHGVPLDSVKLKKELGDTLWYITAIASDNGLTLEDVAQTNIAKLRERYPDGWVKGGGVRETERLEAALGQSAPALADPQCPQVYSDIDALLHMGRDHDVLDEAPLPQMIAQQRERIRNEPGVVRQEPLLADIAQTSKAASGVYFSCGCSESIIDGKLQRRYCPNNCRRLKRE